MKSKDLKFSASESQAIAVNLSLLLKKHKVSDNDVAQALDIPIMTIRRLLSGETTDPKISTLKPIADFLDVTINALLETDNRGSVAHIGKVRPVFVPLLDWAKAEEINSIKDMDLSNWKEWQPISISKQDPISEDTFALESRPSMYPRFPQGTIFIIDPSVQPSDGDMVLIKINNNNELTLRELVIDPPEWQLNPVVPGASPLQYTQDKYKIVGVVILTLLFNRKKLG